MNFYATCELCGKKSELYGGFPTCRDCGTTICLECAVPDSVDVDYDHYDGICKDCEKESETYRLAQLEQLAAGLDGPPTAAQIRGDE